MQAMAEAVCASGKIGYENATSAENALVWLRRKGRDEQRVYRCGRCGYWHLTSIPLGANK
jgi:hypothetical protein